MAKKSSASFGSYTTSTKSKTVEEPKVEAPEVTEAPQARPGSFAALISQ